MSATSASWKSLDRPSERESLNFEAVFTDADAEQMMRGFVPEAMEDKWFIYYESGWLHFLRSWSGAMIYAIRLDGSPVGVRVIDSWVSRDPAQYRGMDINYERELLRYLIDRILLNKDAAFPSPPGIEDKPEGIVRHHFVGR